MIEAQPREQLNGVALRRVTPSMIARGIAGAPMNEFILWTGHAYAAKADSRSAQILGLVDQPGRPMMLRELILRGSRVGGDLGFSPDDVRNAVRMHQRIKGCCHFWVRGALGGGFVLVSDVPYPAGGAGPWTRGRCVSALVAPSIRS